MMKVNTRNETLSTLMNSPARPRSKLRGSSGSCRMRFTAMQPHEIAYDESNAPTPRLVRMLNAYHPGQ